MPLNFDVVLLRLLMQNLSNLSSMFVHPNLFVCIYIYIMFTAMNKVLLDINDD